jgi:hypothetical protein
MRDFFPSFFLKITEDELLYLKNNEAWVLDIFEDFWRLLLDKLDASSTKPAPPKEVSPPDVLPTPFVILLNPLTTCSLS